MRKTFSTGAILAAAVFSASGMPAAHASSGTAALGGALGAVAGVIVGDDMGGRDGAIVGGAIGGAVGAALGTRGGYYYDDYRVVRPRPVYVVPAEPVYVVPSRRVYVYDERPVWVHHKHWQKHKWKHRHDDD